MHIPAIVLGLSLLVIAGVGVTRFNPVVLYSRRTLFGLIVLTIAVIGAVLGLGFFGAPTPPPSGVANLNGG
jgi:hypothetical protein